MRIVLRRLLWAIPTLFVVSALTFVLTALTPGDAAKVLLGTNTDPAAYERLRTELGLDQPLFVRYGEWVAGAVQGNFGRSIFTGAPVVDALNSRLEVTLVLIIGAAILAAIVGVGIGLFGAIRGGAIARSSDSVSLLARSVPQFWIALLLILIFANQLRFLPPTGYVPFAEDAGAWARSIVLPIIALSVGGIAIIAKQTRGAVLDEIGKDYVKALRASGLPNRTIVLRHCLKNAAVPVITVIGLVMISLLGGTVVIEQVFALPGLGQLAVTATNNHDLPILTGVVVYFSLIVVIVNLLVDISYARLNPRMETT